MSAIENRIEIPGRGAIVGARALIISRMKKMGFTYSDLAKEIGRSKSYMYDHVCRGTPKRLNEKDRIRIANLLQLSPDKLRDGNNPLFISTQIPPQVELSEPVSPPSPPETGRLVPLFGEGEPLDPTSAKDWAPALFGPATTSAGAITIFNPIAGRLMPGDTCYLKSDVPVRAGDLVVLMSNEDCSVAALGALFAFDAEAAFIHSKGDIPERFERSCHRLLKIVGTIHP